MKRIGLIGIDWQEEVPKGCDYKQNPERILKLWTEHFYDRIKEQAGDLKKSHHSILMPEIRSDFIQNTDGIIAKAKELALRYSQHQENIKNIG